MDMEDKMRIDQLTPGDQVTLGFCGSDNKVHTEEPATFMRMKGDGTERRAVFFTQPNVFFSPPNEYTEENGYEWSAYRYKDGWVYGTSAQRLRLLSLDVPGLSVPEDFPVKVLKTTKAKASAQDAVTCGDCGRTWDDGVSTSWTPTPAGRCPFEYFHSEVHV